MAFYVDEREGMAELDSDEWSFLFNLSANADTLDWYLDKLLKYRQRFGNPMPGDLRQSLIIDHKHEMMKGT